MFAAETRTEIGNDDANFVLADMKCAGEFASVAERILCSGLDRQFAIGLFGDGCARLKRRMLDVSNVIRLAKGLFG
jgi:hypothetical protein